MLPAPEVLAQHTTDLPGGGIALLDAFGGEVPLIESTSDPQIAHAGDGLFRPADEGEVLASIARIPDPFLAPLRIDIYLLPYPRSGMLASSADDRAIYVTPGVEPYLPAQIHFLIAHEIGHCVHRKFLPDADTPDWRAWAELRGTADSVVFCTGAPHAWRAHEIFAEDFRVLFGGALARGDGSIENASIAPPEEMPGLREFYLDLAGAPLARGWRFAPNPVHDPRRARLAAPDGWAGAVVRAELFDLSGRELAAPVLTSAESGNWAVDLSADPTLSNGAYWLRLTVPGASPVVLSVRLLR